MNKAISFLKSNPLLVGGILFLIWFTWKKGTTTKTTYSSGGTLTPTDGVTYPGDAYVLPPEWEGTTPPEEEPVYDYVF